jgi:hypothetical protein
MLYLPEATLMNVIDPFVALPHKWRALFRAHRMALINDSNFPSRTNAEHKLCTSSFGVKAAH